MKMISVLYIVLWPPDYRDFMFYLWHCNHTKADLDFLRQRLLLKPPLLLLGPLSQSFTRLRDLCPGLLSGSAVVPQQLLDVRRVLDLSSWGVWYSVIKIIHWVAFTAIKKIDDFNTEPKHLRLIWTCLTWCCWSPPGGAVVGTLYADWAWQQTPAWRRPLVGRSEDVCWDSNYELFGKSADVLPSPASSPRYSCGVWEERFTERENITTGMKF